MSNRNKKVSKYAKKEVDSLLMYMGWWDRIVFVFSGYCYPAIGRAQQNKAGNRRFSKAGWEFYLLGLCVICILFIVFCLGVMA